MTTLERYKEIRKAMAYKTWEESQPYLKQLEALYDEEADKLGLITPELRAEWFKDYGTMNCWGDEKNLAYSIACRLHGRDKAANPELHKVLPQRHNWRCWHESNCSCGLCSSCDSSD